MVQVNSVDDRMVVEMVGCSAVRLVDAGVLTDEKNGEGETPRLLTWVLSWVVYEGERYWI